MCADKPSTLYAVINKATTNIPSQYAIPTARTPVAAEKVHANTGPCKQADIDEETKGSDIPPNKSLDFIEVKENTNNKSFSFYSLKYMFVIAFIIVIIVVVVSVVIALFLQMRNLPEMNREL